MKTKIGELGEEIGVIFLEQKGYKIIDRNWKVEKLGELDIVAEKDGKYYFFEVKTSSESLEKAYQFLDDEKIKRFEMIVRKYLIEKKILEKEVKMVALFVYLNQVKKEAKVRIVEDFWF